MPVVAGSALQRELVLLAWPDPPVLPELPGVAELVVALPRLQPAAEAALRLSSPPVSREKEPVAEWKLVPRVREPWAQGERPERAC